MLDVTSRALTRQVAATCRQLRTTDALPFAQHLPEQQIHQAVRDADTVFRRVLYTPATTLWMFLSQCLDPDHSCRAAVARLVAHLAATDQPACSADAGGYCKARARLPEAALANLARQSGRQVLDKAERPWLWKGRVVKVVDGTCVSMPDTEANRKEYPQHPSQKEGVGFPIMRLVVVFSLAVGTALEAAMARYKGKGTGELSLLRSMPDPVGPGEVLLGDSFYSTYWEVARVVARGGDVVLRLKGSRAQQARHGRRLPGGSRQVVWHRSQRPEAMTAEEYAAIPERLTLRVVYLRVRQPGFRTKALWVVTTLLDAAAVTNKDLTDLYLKRWSVELDLRSLKITLQMDVLRGQSPSMVRKEVWAHLLAYNVARAVMAEAARGKDGSPREISFAGAMQTLNAFVVLLWGAGSREVSQRLWSRLIAAVGRHRVGNRPNRYEPRAVKRRPKGYNRLNEPREKARKRLAAER